MTKNYEYYSEEGLNASSASRASKRAERMIDAFQARHYQLRGQKVANLYELAK